MSLIRIRCKLPNGEVKWVGEDLRDYTAPLDLAAAPIGGARVVDGRYVSHTGDRLTTEYGYTATGNLYAVSPENLDALYFRLKRWLAYADQIWLGQRYLNLSYALIAVGTADPTGCVVPEPIVCAVNELRWYDRHGRPLE